MTTLQSVRAVTTTLRPGGDHGCTGVEIIPGVWTAHYDDIKSLDSLKSVAPPVTLVINVAMDKCPVVDYGSSVRIVAIDLLDDPDEMKAIDHLPDGPDKDERKKALLETLATGNSGMATCGNAKKDFEYVNSLIDETLSSEGGGGAVLIHCLASLSRSPAFILAYMMMKKRMTLVEATTLFKSKWDACWPADSFVMQLIEYEKELGL
jgi:hypothetical protein